MTKKKKSVDKVLYSGFRILITKNKHCWIKIEKKTLSSDTKSKFLTPLVFFKKKKIQSRNHERKKKKS